MCLCQVMAVLHKLRALFALYWLTMEVADFLEHGLVRPSFKDLPSLTLDLYKHSAVHYVLGFPLLTLS